MEVNKQLPDSFDSVSGKINSLYQTVNKFSTSKSLDTLDQKIRQVNSSVTSLTQGRSLTTLSSGIDRLAKSLDGLNSSSNLSNFSRQINLFTKSLEQSMSKIGAASSVSTSGGLSELPKVFGSLSEAMPGIRGEFSLLRAEIEKTQIASETFGSSLRGVLDSDLKNPLTNVEKRLTEMFSPNGPLYGAMEDYFSEISKKLSGIGKGSSGGSGSSGSGVSGGGGMFSPIVSSSYMLGTAFGVLAYAATNAANRLDEAFTNLNSVKQSAGMSPNSVQYKQLYNSTFKEFQRLNSKQGNIYSIQDYTGALNQLVQSGARGNSINSLLPIFMQQNKMGPAFDPATAQMIYQIYQRSGLKGVQGLQNTILNTKTLNGVPDLSSVVSGIGQDSGLLGMVTPSKSASAAQQLVRLGAAVSGSTGSMSGVGQISSFLQNILTMGPEQIQQLQQQTGASGMNITQTYSAAKSGNFIKAFQSLLGSYSNARKNTGNSLATNMYLSQLGLDPSTLSLLTSISNDPTMFNNILKQSGSSVNPIASQAQIARYNTPTSAAIANGFESSSLSKGLSLSMQTGVFGHSITAKDLTDLGLASFAAYFGLHHSGHGPHGFAGGMLGKGLRKGTGKIASLIEPHVHNKLLKDALNFLSHGHGGGTAGSEFSAPSSFKGISYDNPLPVYVVGTKGGSSSGGGDNNGSGGGKTSNSPWSWISNTWNSIKTWVVGGAVFFKTKLMSWLRQFYSDVLDSLPSGKTLIKGGPEEDAGPEGALLFATLSLPVVQKASKRYNSLISNLLKKENLKFHPKHRGGPTITSMFGMRNDPFTGQSGFHPGVDIEANSGANFSTPVSGVVSGVRRDPMYGNAVSVQGIDGLTRIFGHASSIGVQTGQTVSGGQVIGQVGSTGRSTGPHLHYEVRNGGVPVNPLGMGGPTSNSVNSAINYWASNYGVPKYIAYSIAQSESSLNPMANVLDTNGVYSTGLYQLNQMGQGYGYTVAQLQNPYLNAEIGLRYIGAAYAAAKSRGVDKDNPIALAGWVAGHSGHPGGSPSSSGYYSSLTQSIEGNARQYLKLPFSALGGIGTSSASPSSPLNPASPSSYAGYFTPTHNGASALALASAAIAASAGASPTSYQATLSQAMANMSGNSSTIDDVVKKLENIHAETKKTNEHLNSSHAVHQAIHVVLKRSLRSDTVSHFG